MSETKIIKQFTKFIYPFTFEKEEIDVQETFFNDKNGNPQQLFETISIKGTYLRDGLDELMDQNGNSTKIADCYRVNPNYRGYFDLPSHSNKEINFFCRNDKATPHPITVESVQLYLFESGVGFVDVECNFKDCNIDEFLHLNYFIGEAKSENNRFEWIDKKYDPATGETTSVVKTFTLQSLVSKISQSVSAKDGCSALKFDFYNATQRVYSHLLLSEMPQDFDDVLFHATKNYKESYKFSGETNVSTTHPFKNSYWSSSMNGAVNISYLTGDRTTDYFFENDFYSKLHNTYFLLFMCVLHQKQAIELMLAKMGQLDAIGQDYVTMYEQLKKAERYDAEAHNLKFRSFFNHPSNIEHVNEYYEMLKESFSIDALYNNFRTDLSGLQDICRTYVDRINAREAKFAKIRMIKAEIFVAVLGSLVGEFSLLSTSWDLIEKIVGHEVSFFSPQILLVIATLLVPLVTIFFSVKKMVIEVNQMRRELCEEKERRLVEDDKSRRRKIRLSKKNRTAK